MYTLTLKIFIFYSFLIAYPRSKQPPIALMKTNSEVEPAEINGSGKPVGGIEPLNISYCIINFNEQY